MKEIWFLYRLYIVLYLFHNEVILADFLEREIAQYALKEAIKLAQEAGDNVCLQLAHSWVSYLTSEEHK